MVLVKLEGSNKTRGGLALGDIATTDLGRSGMRQVGRLRDANESNGRIG